MTTDAQTEILTAEQDNSSAITTADTAAATALTSSPLAPAVTLDQTVDACQQMIMALTSEEQNQVMQRLRYVFGG